MTKAINVEMTLTPIPVPAGTTQGNLRVWLLQATGGVISTKDTDQPSVSFPDVVPGNYVIMAVRLDIAGATVGDPVKSDVFSVPEDMPTATITVDVPTAVRVSVA